MAAVRLCLLFSKHHTTGFREKTRQEHGVLQIYQRTACFPPVEAATTITDAHNNYLYLKGSTKSCTFCSLPSRQLGNRITKEEHWDRVGSALWRMKKQLLLKRNWKVEDEKERSEAPWCWKKSGAKELQECTFLLEWQSGFLLIPFPELLSFVLSTLEMISTDK